MKLISIVGTYFSFWCLYISCKHRVYWGCKQIWIGYSDWTDDASLTNTNTDKNDSWFCFGFCLHQDPAVLNTFKKFFYLMLCFVGQLGEADGESCQVSAEFPPQNGKIFPQNSPKCYLKMVFMFSEKSCRHYYEMLLKMPHFPFTKALWVCPSFIVDSYSVSSKLLSSNKPKT